MKALLLGIVAALAAIVGTSSIAWWKRLITAIVAAAIGISVTLWVPGCMATTDLDGKVYSTRLDILAPIGATVPPPAWEDARPIIIQAAPTPTSQPAAQPAAPRAS
jgi:uncharacterized protein YggT (Ycf19 family)